MGRQVRGGGAEAATTTLLYTLFHDIFTKYPLPRTRSRQEQTGWGGQSGEIAVKSRRIPTKSHMTNSLISLYTNSLR